MHWVKDNFVFSKFSFFIFIGHISWFNIWNENTLMLRLPFHIKNVEKKAWKSLFFKKWQKTAFFRLILCELGVEINFAWPQPYLKTLVFVTMRILVNILDHLKWNRMKSNISWRKTCFSMYFSISEIRKPNFLGQKLNLQ